MKQHHHLEALMIKRAQVVEGNRVRYRVYQSASEYIAVIAESALMAIRISGVKNPYKVVRDLPTAQATVEKGKLDTVTAGEKVSISTKQFDDVALNVVVERETSEAFMPMALLDIYKKRNDKISILSPEQAMKHFEVTEPVSTIVAPPSPPPMPSQPAMSVAAPDPVVTDKKEEALSQEEISRLLGDV